MSATRHHIDLVGIRCPLPIVSINQEFKHLQLGDELEVIADDPAFRPDIEAWCELTGQRLITVATEGRVTRVVLERAA